MIPFEPTGKTFVRGFVERAPDALRQFCEKYRAPLVAYARRDSRLTHGDAEECVDNLLIEFSKADKSIDYDCAKGRFRAFLLASLNNRIHTFYRDLTTQKRGGRIKHIPLDEALEESAPTASTHAFDREWALQITILAMARLEAEYTTVAQKRRFAQTKGALTAVLSAAELAGLATSLEILPESLETVIRQMRAAFGRCLRAEVRESLYKPTEAEVEAEFSYLRDVLKSVNF